MKKVLLAFLLATTAFAGPAAGDSRSLEARIRVEINSALSSGIASFSGSVSAGFVKVAVTPGLSEIIEKEDSSHVLSILARIQNAENDPEQRQLRAYIDMCLMVFPEKKHWKPSKIIFPAGRVESVVFYMFPLARFLGKEPNTSPNLTPDGMAHR